MESPQSLSFFVPGIPAPGGSKKAFVNRKTGKANMVDMGTRNKDWRATVAMAASVAMNGRGLYDVPLAVRFIFQVLRPKGHFGTGKNAAIIKAKAPKYPASIPDALKLARSTEDAMTGIVWRDDAQTVSLIIHKEYAIEAGCHISVKPLI